MDGMNVEEFLSSGILDGGAVDAESVPDVPQRDDGGMSPLHALAFSVWAFEAGGDVQLTQQIVEERSGVKVPLHQLREWRNGQSWGVEKGKFNQTLKNFYLQETRSTLMLATIRAGSALLRIVSDPNAKDSDVLSAAKTILDRTGFPVVLRGEMFDGLTIGHDINDVSDDELEAQWLEYGRETGGVTEGVIAPDPIAERHGDTSRIRMIQNNEYRASMSGRAYIPEDDPDNYG